MAKGLQLLLCLSLMLATHPARARRAVGRHEVVETVVTARGAQERDTDEWNEVGDDDDDERPPVTSSSSRPPPPPRDDRGSSGAAASSSSSPPSLSRKGGVASVKDSGSVAAEGPIQLSVEQRGLVTPDVSAASILQEHQAWHAEEGTKRFSGETLGYVTPWNGRGYDFARTFRSKLDYVSPAWYQLRGWPAKDSGNPRGGDASDASPPSEDLVFSLTGGHDFDEAWVSDVRDGVEGERGNGGRGVEGDGGVGGGGGVTKIVPRVVLEVRGRVQLTGSHLLEMAGLLVQEAMLRGYHGYVLDIPVTDGIEQFVSGLVTTALDNGVDLLIIQSVRPGTVLTRHQIDHLVPLIHRFSLMTYDFHHVAGGEPGAIGVPNSPLPWVRQTVEAFAPQGEGGAGDDLRGKVLLGMPFYGYDGGRALSYHDAVSILKGEQSAGGDGGGLSDSDRAPSMFWNAPAAEHFMSYLGRDGEQHIANYPTLAFIQERIALAQELGVGLALWELGQGMPYFFDLF